VVISIPRKYVFVNLTKCASQSLRAILVDHFDGKPRLGTHHMNDVPHGYRNFFTFACVRNPYDRAISLWYSMLYTRPDDRYGFRKHCGSIELVPFLKWLNSVEPYNALMFSQYGWLRDISMSMVLRFENLDEEVKRLPFWRDDVKLERRNASKGRKPWQDYMTDEVVNLINVWARDDFSHFGYERLDAPPVKPESVTT